MRILTADDVRAALPMHEAIDAMRMAFTALSQGRATVPLRTMLETPQGVVLYMPAYIEGEPISVVKVVSVNPDNPAKEMPTVQASVLVLDADTGQPLGLMDGTSLTAIRTGAASGLATDLLAREDARVLGVIGAGVQARTQIEAVCCVREIREIRVYSRQRAHELADEVGGQYDAEVYAVDSARAAVTGADVVVTATNTIHPVVQATDIGPGTHVNGIGSFTRVMQEVGAEVVTRAKVVVDHRESAWAEAGDLIVPLEMGLIDRNHVYAELGEIAGGQMAGRTSREEITFFKSVGNAVQDAAAAAHVYAHAEARDLGMIAIL